MFLLLKVAGIRFAFDPSKPPGERVIAGLVTVGREPLALDKTYRLCTTDFIAQGKDGYDCLLGSQVLVNDEDGPLLSTVVQNHFLAVSYFKGLRKFKYYHHQSIIYRSERRTASQRTVMQDEPDASADDEASAKRRKSGGRRLWKKARTAFSVARRLTIEEAETKEIESALAPKIEQRCQILSGGSV